MSSRKKIRGPVAAFLWIFLPLFMSFLAWRWIGLGVSTVILILIAVSHINYRQARFVSNCVTLVGLIGTIVHYINR